MDVKEVERVLNVYLMPQTFPLAIRMLKSEAEIPEKCRRPLRDMKKRVAICQGIGMSRKLGWTVAMGKEDMSCSLGAAPFGFFKDTSYWAEGNICAGMFTATREAGKREEDQIDRFAYGQYSHILVAPLGRATFDPHMLLIYGNPAQMMRLVQGALYLEGGSVSSSSLGRLGCASIITVLQHDECRYLIPGNGDRIFGMTQDHEMSFYIPVSKVTTVMEGLVETHNRGVRYPITAFFNFEASFPAAYQEQMRLWREAGEI